MRTRIALHPGQRLVAYIFSVAVLGAILLSGVLSHADAAAPDTLSERPGNPAGERLRIVPDNLFHVKFVDDTRGFITGYHGTLLRTDDGGQSWHYTPLNSHELIRRGAFPSRDKAWLVGHRGSIFHTDDGGQSWVVQHQQDGIYLRDIAFLDDERGCAVGHEGTILCTDDGGASWQARVISDYTRRDKPRLSGITFLDSSRAVATGEFGTVAYTDDGGESWRHVTLDGEPTMTAIASAGERIMAVGLDGAVAQMAFTPDGFVAQRLELNIPTHLLDIRMTRVGVLAAGFGVVVRCTDAGCALLPPAPGLETNFLWFGGVDLAADGSIWSVGLNGTVARAASPSDPLEPRFVLGGPGWAEARATKKETQE